MGDMRKDYILERDVIVHPTTKKSTDSKKCSYCPGNESMTNPSLLSLVAKDGMLQRLQDGEDFFVTDWSVRVFESKEPAVSTSTPNTYSDRPLYSEPAYGYHYIVVASPNHKESLATIDTEQWSNVLVVVQDRLRWLYTQKGVTYVSIFVNHGKESGADVQHSHINMVSFSTLPPRIEDEAESSHKILNEKGVCPMCQAVSTAAQGADVLIHEALSTEDSSERTKNRGHSTAAEAGQIASSAGAKRLVMTHIDTKFHSCTEKLIEEAMQYYSGPIQVADDLTQIVVES